MRAFDDAQNEKIRARMRAWIETEGGGRQSVLAAKLGIKPPSLNVILEGGGVSYMTASAMARLVNCKVEDLAGPAADPTTQTVTDIYPERARAVVRARAAKVDDRAIRWAQSKLLRPGESRSESWWLARIASRAADLEEFGAPGRIYNSEGHPAVGRVASGPLSEAIEEFDSMTDALAKSSGERKKKRKRAKGEEKP